MLKHLLSLSVCLSLCLVHGIGTADTGMATAVAGNDVFASVAGWQATSDVSTYDESNLWKYINGAADQYLACGFRQLACCDMTRDELTVVASVYDMGSRLNAFGIFGVERSANAPTLTIGAGAQLSAPYQGLMLKDRYYVRIDAFKGELTDDAGRDLLQAMAVALPGTDELPAELATLPDTRKVPGSETYTRESYLGLGELRRCLHATYTDDAGTEFEIFTIVADPGSDLDAIWVGLAQKWQAAADTAFPVLTRAIPYEGPVGVMRNDSGIYGVFGAADQAVLIASLEVLAQSLH